MRTAREPDSSTAQTFVPHQRIALRFTAHQAIVFLLYEWGMVRREGFKPPTFGDFTSRRLSLGLPAQNYRRECRDCTDHRRRVKALSPLGELFPVILNSFSDCVIRYSELSAQRAVTFSVSNLFLQPVCSRPFNLCVLVSLCASPASRGCF